MADRKRRILFLRHERKDDGWERRNIKSWIILWLCPFPFKMVKLFSDMHAVQSCCLQHFLFLSFPHYVPVPSKFWHSGCLSWSRGSCSCCDEKYIPRQFLWIPLQKRGNIIEVRGGKVWGVLLGSAYSPFSTFCWVSVSFGDVPSVSDGGNTQKDCGTSLSERE